MSGVTRIMGTNTITSLLVLLGVGSLHIDFSICYSTATVHLTLPISIIFIFICFSAYFIFEMGSCYAV